MDRVIFYEEVVSYINKPEVILVDVRNPEEIKETGIILSGINIPFKDLEASLQIEDNEEFKRKFGRDLPSKDMMIVFSCNKGGRGTKAMETAISMGFTNSRVYKGGWNDWSSRVDV